MEEHLLHAKRMHSRRKYTKKGNKGDSSQEREEYKEGVGASNKPKGDVWALIQDHVRGNPEVFHSSFG